MRLPLLLLVVLPALALAGCVKDPARPDDGDDPPEVPPSAFPRHELAFSGERALDQVRAQMTAPNGSIQYRVPGTAGHARVAQYIENEMAALGWRTDFQSWTTDYACRETPLRNVVAWRRGETNRTVILGAHYDTRPVSDKESDPALRALPVPGANDGASGVAVLLELARVLQDRAPNLTLVFVYFDAEDGGDLPRDLYPCSTGWIMGSLRFMGSYDRRAGNLTEAVVVVDMVGDTDLRLAKEGFSAEGPGKPVQDLIWETGRRLGHGDVFLDRPGPKITDDHRAFLDPPAIQRFGRPLPAVDIIHLDPAREDPFPATHHRRSDDLGNVSAQSLAAVGRTLEHVLLDADRAPLPGTITAGRPPAPRACAGEPECVEVTVQVRRIGCVRSGVCPPPGQEFVRAEVTLENTGTAPRAIDPFWFVLYTADGLRRAPAPATFATEPALEPSTLAAGASASGRLVFDVPAELPLDQVCLEHKAVRSCAAAG